MDDLFIIAAGGSGSKVVEAVVHLCAAGLCPPEVHVLLVDGDASNGNRQRTIETWNAYKAVQGWPWRFAPKTAKAEEVVMFQSKLEIYALSERFSVADTGSLRPLVCDDEPLHEALSVLLDNQELDMNMRVGFTGRPNLGCLVMSRYLQRHLRNHDRAKAFVQALETSARNANARPRIAVVGSVFGGTGASLLPVVRASIQGVFKGVDANNNPRENYYNRMMWGKIMLLPFFRPQGGVNLGIVNPARHFIDTSGALWYYGLGQSATEPTYLVGSDCPEQRKTVAVGGEVSQNNPAFFHELLTALAILDFHGASEVESNQPVRHFSAVTQFTQNGSVDKESCVLSKLPVPRGFEPDQVQSRLALLFHLAAFSIDWRDSSQADFPEYCRGLFQYGKMSNLTGWNNKYHKKLSSERLSLLNKGGPCQQLIKYHARLLLWAGTTLSESIDYTKDAGQYSSLHNTLCTIEEEDVDVNVRGTFPEGSDNLVAKLSRLALAGLMRENASQEGTDYCGHGLNLAPNPLMTREKAVKLGLDSAAIPVSLQYHGFEKPDVEKWYAEFRVPMP